MSELNYSELFIQRFLHVLKLAIFANKNCKSKANLDSAANMYNHLKAIDLKGMLDEEDKKTYHKYTKAFNLAMKVDEEGNQLNIKDSSIQNKLLSYEPFAPIKTKDLQAMRNIVKDNDVSLFLGVNLSFILEKNKQNKHEEVTWRYLLACFDISQIYFAMEESDDVILTEATNSLENNFARIKILEKKLNINKILKKDTFLKSYLIQPSIKHGIEASTKLVKEMLTSRGLKEDSIMFKLLGKITDKFSDMDENDDIMSKAMSFFGELNTDMKEELRANGQDLKSNLGTLMSMLREVTNGNEEELEKVPEGLRNIFTKLSSIFPEDPNAPIDEEKMRELSELTKNNFSEEAMKNMTKEMGANPKEIAELEAMIKKATPGQLSSALTFKL